jgi:GT2 family glycosyltransferase
MVYGDEHVNHIKHMVIPALAKQTYNSTIELHLVNYAASTSHFSRTDNLEDVHVYDHSDKRKNIRIGFGEGINYLFKSVMPEPYFLCLNPDTLLDGKAISALTKRFDLKTSGIIEAQQWPSEHPKEHDQETGHTPWASGACALMSSQMFSEIGGFDALYFLYCEDVDISWRAWLAGREVVYEPKAKVMHYTGLLHYRTDRYYYEHFYSARNFILISRKFFGERGEKRAISLLSTMPYSDAFKHQVKSDYACVKPQIKEVSSPVQHPMIKILGFNLYHVFKSEAHDD